MATVNGWCAGGGWPSGRRVFSQFQTFSDLFWKILTDGAVTTEVGSLFQYFTTLTEKADPLLRRMLAPRSTL